MAELKQHHSRGPLRQFLEKANELVKEPTIAHLAFDEEDAKRTACGKSLSNKIVYVTRYAYTREQVTRCQEAYNRYLQAQAEGRPANWYEASYNYYLYVDRHADCIAPNKWRQPKDHIQVSLCPTCYLRHEERTRETANARLRGQYLVVEDLKAKFIPPPTAEELEEAKLKEAGMLPPARPPGTEAMTGHLEEGSPGGACGGAGSGFKTDYLPWVNCMDCLVQLDEFSEQGLLRVHGYYVKVG